MRLGTVLAQYRWATKQTTRELAAEIGLSAATLNRIESGHKCSGEDLVKILVWLLVEPVKTES